MNIITVRDAAKRWGLTERRVREIIREGKIAGSYKIGTAYVIPANTQKPPDERLLRGALRIASRNAKKKNRPPKTGKDGERE